MKKIISGLLIFASLAGGMGAFTSCKDSDDDQFAAMQREDYRLMQQIQELQRALEAAKQQYAIDLSTAIANLEAAVADKYVTKTEYEALVRRVEALEAKVCQCGDLQQKLVDLETKIMQWVTDQGYLTVTEFNAYKTLVESTYAKITDLDKYALSSELALYVTKTEFNQTLTNYVKLSDLPDFTQFITADKLNEYLKSADLDGEIARLIADNASATYTELMKLIDANRYDDTAVKTQLTAIQGVLTNLGYTFNSDGTIQSSPSWANSETITDAISQANWVSTNKTSLEYIIANFKDIDPSKLATTDDLEDYLSKDDAAKTYVTQEAFEAYKTQVSNDITNLTNLYNQLSSDLDKVETDVATLQKLLKDYSTWRQQITDKVQANADAIAALQQKYGLVNDRLDAMITSINAEGADNPVFGSFAAPVGMASNVLMTYFGQYDRSVPFPAFIDTYEFDNNLSTVITTEDYRMLMQGATQQKYGETSEYVVPGSADNNYLGNAGTLYFTVNPGNVDMTGKAFTLVNSQNEPTTVAISAPVKSDKVLTFGYSRASEDVALWEAQATLLPNEADIAACRVNVDAGLASAARDFATNFTSASSLASLMAKVYDQFNGILPRLAVKAEWTYTTSSWDDASAAWVDATADGIARSGLDVAATAFKPLSFKSLEGREFSRQLPLIDEFNFDWDKIIPEIGKINIPEINLDGIKYNFAISQVNITSGKDLNVTINFFTGTTVSFTEPTSWSIDSQGREYAKVLADIGSQNSDTTNSGTIIIYKNTGENRATAPYYYVDPQTLTTYYLQTPAKQGDPYLAFSILSGKVDPNDKNGFIAEIQEAFNSMVDSSNKQINEEFQKVMEQLSEKINETIINTVQTQINDIFDQLIDDLTTNIDRETGKYFDKLNSLINKYNSLANRINGVLSNPSHYMQVTMLYRNGQGNFGLLSTNANAPTPFSVGGNSSAALMLYPTTYNAEIVTPCFKKYVAFCNAVANDDATKSAQGGDANALAALNKANNSAGGMATVLEGSTLRVATGVLTPGYTYSVAYQALDYRSYTSTNKYYIKVVE